MSWARRRQAVISALIVVAAIIVLALLYFKFFYQAPMCTDGRQDGKETGVDCGGPCPYLCSITETPLHQEFARAVSPSRGRTDVIAYVDNSNTNAAAENVSYTLDIYDTQQDLLAEKTGTIVVPPSGTAPLYIPRAYVGPAAVAETFLTLGTTSTRWLRTAGTPTEPTPTSTHWTLGSNPSVTAQLQNDLATPITDYTVIATVFDAHNNAIAAAQTVAPSIPAQGSASIIFNWNAPFPAAPARVEILPAYGP